MRRGLFAPVLAGVCAIILLGGCQASLRSLIEHAERTRVSDDPVFIDITDVISLDIESFNGDVFVRVEANLAQAMIELKREGLHGQERHAESVRSLDEISLSAEIVPGELGQTLRVRASTTHGEPHLQRAHISIHVPPVDGVRIVTGNGRVEVKGVAGAISIDNQRGDVIIASARPLTELVMVNVAAAGDIHYRVRGESSGDFDCETGRGRVLNRVQYGRWRILRGSSEDRLVATLNEGENLVSLRTADGNIRVVVVPDPEVYGLYILD